MNAAAAGIRLAQTAYLPRVDGLAQVNRATRNTFSGCCCRKASFPAWHGVPANNFGTVWGSAMGVLVTWEPFDFGLRRANVAAATAAREQAQATVKRTRFDVSVATADAYLTVVAAQETAQAARAAVDSWQILLKKHSCAGSGATAAGRGRIASAGGTGGGADATRPGAAGHRRGARDAGAIRRRGSGAD